MGTLYLVSTPIGNLEDITIRALKTLYSVDLILCEDTRESGKLLDHYKKEYGSYPPLLSYNDFNREKRIPEVLLKLQQGQGVALISDRGTPLLSDPGYKLVQAVYEFAETNPTVTIDAIPGANALLPALQLSGLPPDTFTFVGFLPKKTKKQHELLETLSNTTAVAYESPKRLVSTLTLLDEHFDEVEVAVALELTKMFQDIQRGSVHELVVYFTNHPAKGEVTIVFRGT